MTRLVKAAADRLLSAVLPTTKAAATCGGFTWRRDCQCYPGERRSTQTCVSNCDGSYTCGSCYYTQTVCPG